MLLLTNNPHSLRVWLPQSSDLIYWSFTSQPPASLLESVLAFSLYFQQIYKLFRYKITYTFLSNMPVNIPAKILPEFLV